MGLMSGKRGLIVGIANERSYAYFVAKQLIEQGAECLFTFMPIGKMEHRVGKAVQNLGVETPWLESMDAGQDEDLDRVFGKIKEDFGTIDFVVHAIAFADRNYLKPDMFHVTPRDAFLQAMDVSAYTMLGFATQVMKLDLMPQGGSMLNLSYYGGEKVTPGYNVMGVAKACLEHTTRYLAYELGDKKDSEHNDCDAGRNIRVNCISAGPFKTLAGAGVGGMDEMIAHQERKASMKRANTGEEVGNTAVYLLSDLSTGVTGETIHVDCGFSIIGL